MDLPSITAPDADARAAASARQAQFPGPHGALGKLADLGSWLAGVQGVCPPYPPRRVRVLVLAADHGIAAAGVSTGRPGGTADRVAAVNDGVAPIAVLAAAAGATGRVIDIGLAEGAPTEHRVRDGSGRIDTDDALTAEEVARAFEIGRRIVDQEVDEGADLLVPAAVGVGATTPAAVLVAALTSAEPVAVIGRGSGIDDAGWSRKTAAVRDALRRTKPYRGDPMALLRVAGGADLAALAGLCLQAAVRRTPVVIDGVVIGAAALLADRLAGTARAWWLLAGCGADPAERRIGDALGLSRALDLGLRLGDGAGGVALLPLLAMAARLMSETAPARS